jgi:hypothetical protein
VGTPSGGLFRIPSNQHRCGSTYIGTVFSKRPPLEWWTTQKDVAPNLMGSLPWNAFEAKLNERFIPHN